MSFRIRGQEAVVRFVVNNNPQVSGTFTLVNDLTITPRTDLTEESYLGEVLDKIDVQHHGYDVSFTVNNEDSKSLQFMVELASNEENQTQPQDVSMTIIQNFRDGLGPERIEMQNIVLKVTEHGFGGRKEFVSTSFEGKAERMVVVGLRSE